MREKDRINILNSIEDIQKLKCCGPSDDPDMQTAVIYEFVHLLKSFKYFASKIEDPVLLGKVQEIRTEIEQIYDVYEVNSDISPLLVDIKDYLLDDNYQSTGLIRNEYIDTSLIERLKNVNDNKFDTKKLVRFCEEINSNYQNQNWIAVTLLIRAILNHIPPIFGHQTFNQVVSNSTKSVKALLAPLEENLRDIADLHTHNLIKRKESIPTERQIEPFKANLEILLHEILSKLE